jgi:nucleotide-binding universal stress UspA family protein
MMSRRAADASTSQARSHRHRANRQTIDRQPKMFERIVAGYGGDQAGKDAVMLAANLAALSGSDLAVVFRYQPLFASVSGDVAEQRVRQEVASLTAGIDGLKLSSFHWTPSSWPIHGLHEMARYEDADLIVIGSARAGLADHLHVSLMERMVHAAPCAVAVAPARYADVVPAPFLRVGVGFSSSEEGSCALRLGHELAARTGGRLTVIAGAGLEPALASYAYSSPALPEVERQIYEETKATLERVTHELDDEVRVEGEVLSGDPAGVLVERSRELDILVLGSRAYGPLRHVLLGSVSARVMRDAHCPVVVVPRGVGSDHHAPDRLAVD